MRNRCYRPKDVAFDRYGGRGIEVCERWRNSFEHFLADMGPKPSPEYTIDRIDNDGNYEPQNCRWAMPDVQSNNTRKIKLVTVRGETLSVAKACRKFAPDMAVATVYTRLAQGWTVEQALFAPPAGR